MTAFSKKYFKYIKASGFLPDYCNIPNSATTRHKMRGTDGNKKPTDFSEEEKTKIRRGIVDLANELKAE